MSSYRGDKMPPKPSSQFVGAKLSRDSSGLRHGSSRQKACEQGSWADGRSGRPGRRETGDYSEGEESGAASVQAGTGAPRGHADSSSGKRWHMTRGGSRAEGVTKAAGAHD
eukprot:779716-Prymnesium_polylepis.1